MITVEKQTFLNAIKAVKVASTKADLQPVLQTINLKKEKGGLSLTATDCSNLAKMVIEANVKGDINICINAERLDAIVSRLDDVVEIEVEGATVIFKSGKTRYKCLYIEGSEFPDYEITLEGEKAVLSYQDFINGVNKTCFAAQNDNTRSIICGVYFNFDNKTYEMVSTDGNRLCQVQFDNVTGIKGGYTVPKIALTSVAKVIKNDVEIYFNEKYVIFKSENYIYQTRLLAGQFPPYKQLIPTQFEINIPIDKTEFCVALDKVSIMANERTQVLKMCLKDNEMILLTDCQDGDAKDTLEIDYADEEFCIGFNYHYLLEGIKAMSGDVILLNINNNSSAVLIKSDFNYLVMPVQLEKIQG